MSHPESARPATRPSIIAASAVVALSCLLVPPADAQSDASLRQSQASLAASVEVPVAVVGALSQGGRFVIDAVVVSGASVAVTISAVGVGTSFVVYLAADTVKRLAIATGKAVEAVAVSAGWLLVASGETLCFVANDAARAHVHSREITA